MPLCLSSLPLDDQAPDSQALYTIFMPEAQPPVGNVCGLYYKLPGSAHPISMKSNIICKCSRHDTCVQGSSLTDPPRASNTPGTLSETPSQTQTPPASPGISCHPMPLPSPILAPDKLGAVQFDWHAASNQNSSPSSALNNSTYEKFMVLYEKLHTQTHYHPCVPHYRIFPMDFCSPPLLSPMEASS
ncbi:uncharacterized protein EDB91DRAFT_1249932 [Suillus paluster]|uniref:uncharacterized protein n=1 Tax=Suillus paluster TaxID=48578 RepID=UPI001B85DC35|nr:uncharacterized protein EDB91DRAFT_1249932 [Suillus paluster]KAG1736627.1 hypothetical protein EDB91DRAFT_1249932 [Suillus paluster]